MRPAAAACLTLARWCGPDAGQEPIAWPGLVYYPYNRALWRAFACEKHKDARLCPLRFGTRPEHQAKLDDRRRRLVSTLAGKHEPVEPIHIYGKPGDPVVNSVGAAWHAVF